MHALQEIGIKIGSNMAHFLKICIYSGLHHWYVKLNGTQNVTTLDFCLCSSPTADFTVVQIFHWLRFVKFPLFLNGKITTAPSLTVSALRI